MKNPLANLLIRWAILALGVALAAKIVPGITYHDNGVVLLLAALLLGFFNAVLRPILLFFTLPFIVLTLGIGVFVINALLFLWVGHLIRGFDVTGFGPALGGSLIVSITNLLLSSLLRPKDRKPPPSPGLRRAHGQRANRDDVIDI